MSKRRIGSREVNYLINRLRTGEPKLEQFTGHRITHDISEGFHVFELSTVDIDLRSIVFRAGWRLVHDNRFCCTDCKSKIGAACGQEVHAPLHVLLRHRVKGAVVREEQVMDGSRRHARLCLHTPNVEKVPVSSVGDADPRLLVTVGVHQHSREHETEQGRANTQHCFNTLVTANASDTVPSSGSPSEPHLGDDEAVICPTIGIADHLAAASAATEGASNWPSPALKAEEGVSQQETVFRTRLQKKEAVIVTTTETVGAQHSLPGSAVHPDATRVSQITLAARNVRSLLDNPRSNRPERRTALVARELVDIAALSKTRFSEQGLLEEVGAGYTLFWSGRPKAE
ncbi:unnamed protein product [Schistocephalus solidus]|uniref:Yippee domain-containing protein n=1 Tax=Schistocephalus solidus TaxID=70667 RepID=A0A183SEY9_SCHSO|nr:unnamed protein product [Schistocephalus solidus]